MQRSCERNGLVHVKNDILPKICEESQAEREGQRNKGNSHGISMPLEGVQPHHSRMLPPAKGGRFENQTITRAPTTINCKVYPLNTKETNILQDFLQEEERKGYITQGSSPYTAPVFFIGKKDSNKLQPVMDYQEINKWMKQDYNPLPNI